MEQVNRSYTVLMEGRNPITNLEDLEEVEKFIKIAEDFNKKYDCLVVEEKNGKKYEAELLIRKR